VPADNLLARAQCDLPTSPLLWVRSSRLPLSRRCHFSRLYLDLGFDYLQFILASWNQCDCKLAATRFLVHHRDIYNQRPPPTRTPDSASLHGTMDVRGNENLVGEENQQEVERVNENVVGNFRSRTT
jgi:hypothetical protein